MGNAYWMGKANWVYWAGALRVALGDVYLSGVLLNAGKWMRDCGWMHGVDGGGCGRMGAYWVLHIELKAGMCVMRTECVLGNGIVGWSWFVCRARRSKLNRSVPPSWSIAFGLRRRYYNCYKHNLYSLYGMSMSCLIRSKSLSLKDVAIF